MKSSQLSSLDLRAFLRTCHAFLEEGLSAEAWSAFQKHLLISGPVEFAFYARQIKKLSDEEKKFITDGFSNGQLESKLWLLEVLKDVLPAVTLDVRIGGSWFGLLTRLMLWLDPGRFQSIINFDLDPRCEKWAFHLNKPDSFTHPNFYKTQDIQNWDYQELTTEKSVFINTACEHIQDFSLWFSKIPSGTVLVLQGNNFSEHDEHLQCWPDLESFERATPLETVLFSGHLELEKYHRFMRIGVR